MGSLISTCCEGKACVIAGVLLHVRVRVLFLSKGLQCPCQHALLCWCLVDCCCAATVAFDDGERINSQLYQERYEFLPQDGASE